LFGTHPWKANSVAKLADNIKNEPLYFDPSIKISHESQIFLIEALQLN
jgi:hypothetical protein